MSFQPMGFMWLYDNWSRLEKGIMATDGGLERSLLSSSVIFLMIEVHMVRRGDCVSVQEVRGISERHNGAPHARRQLELVAAG